MITKYTKLVNKNILLATCRFKSQYKQGQYADKKIREYFYFIDHQGQLFLDDTKVKNFITCFKDKAFLEFFFKRLRRNSTGYYEETFPYLSLCGRERNYIRCDDTPIVYTHLMEVPSTDKSLRHALSYCGADEKLIVPFKPETLCMLPDTGRVYHEAKDKFGGIGLVKSSLAIELSAGFQFDSYNELLNGAEAAAPPTTFCWNGNEYSLTNEHVHRLTHRNRS